MNIYEYLSLPEKPFDRMVTDGGMCAIFRTIACVGDSLSSGEFESYDDEKKTSWHDMYEYSWGQYIGRSCGSKVYNFSQGGMTSKWYNDTFADKKDFWNPEYAAQAYIIAMGVNDIFGSKMEIGTTADINREDYTKNTDNFIGHYARMIQHYKEIQPKAKFFLVTMPQDDNQPWNELKKKHRDALADLCEFFDNCYLIDLYTYAPVHDKEFKQNYYMGGHLNPMGYVLTARMIETYIDYIIRHNPVPFKQVAFIGTSLHNTTVEK